MCLGSWSGRRRAMQAPLDAFSRFGRMLRRIAKHQPTATACGSRQRAPSHRCMPVSCASQEACRSPRRVHSEVRIDQLTSVQPTILAPLFVFPSFPAPRPQLCHLSSSPLLWGASCMAVSRRRPRLWFVGERHTTHEGSERGCRKVVGKWHSVVDVCLCLSRFVVDWGSSRRAPPQGAELDAKNRYARRRVLRRRRRSRLRQFQVALAGRCGRLRCQPESHFFLPNPSLNRKTRHESVCETPRSGLGVPPSLTHCNLQTEELTRQSFAIDGA